MKKLMFSCAVLMFASIATFAQNTPSAPTGVGQTPQATAANNIAAREASMKKMAEAQSERQAKDLQTRLALSDEQYKKVYEANLEFFNKMNASRNSPDHKMPQPGEMQAIREQKDSKIKEVLNKEQLAKFETMFPKQRPLPTPNPNGAPTPPPPAPPQTNK